MQHFFRDEIHEASLRVQLRLDPPFDFMRIQLNTSVQTQGTTAMAATALFLPGEQIPQHLLPKPSKGTLTLGPGLRHLPPSTILSTTSGALQTDTRKAALWLEHANGRYLPSVNDLVIAQVHHSSTDTYHCSITPQTPFALLGQLAFEGANKKSRPQLKAGDLVYARVSKANKWDDVEIECFNSQTGKGEGLGPLKNGMLFEVSKEFSRRLMMGTDREGKSKGGIVVLELLGEKVRFEVAVGRNGRVWVDSGSVRETVAIGRLLREADEKGLTVEMQKKAIKKVLKDL